MNIYGIGHCEGPLERSYVMVGNSSETDTNAI
jgi:hypothetical protein